MEIDHAPLTGHGVRLEPARPDHAAALFEITPPDTFPYFLSWPDSWTPSAFSSWFCGLISTPTVRSYAVVDERSRAIVGSTSFLDIDPRHRCVEVGATWYDPRVRGTRVNPACKLLMLDHALHGIFRTSSGAACGCVRVTLKCDARNIHSQRAIAKLGATREGVLRRHRIQPNGFVRDTVYFSVLPEEWPRVKEGLLARLGTP